MEGDESTLNDVTSAPSARCGDVFLARPFFGVPELLAPKVYPEIEMSRSSALVDVVIAVGLFVAMFISPQVEALMDEVATRFPTYGRLWSNTIIGGGAIGIVAAILLARRQRPAAVGLGRFGTPAIWGTIAAVPGCYVAMLGTGILYSIYLTFFTDLGVESMLADKQALLDVIPDFSLTTMLLFGVLTGFHEELLFRGLLLTRFNAIARNRAAGVVICAALFGLVHAYQGPVGILQTAAIGLVLGTITTLSKSLWPAIIGHAAFNSIQLAMLPFLKKVLEELTHASTTLPSG
ncbi:MAG: CPBP family intramembrane metalloprotease [Phycisphaerales bacterium]|nr:CPBP family intramembrane metalloprotease [Phycisphaerales bacterium]MCB9856742.1 CPBP family intramembrane metalloprotease [Phycisphaerales bacterium]MCB9862131.1 CPBP family intramembrane metalloprotease [Phycisphaerales bacterium]